MGNTHILGIIKLGKKNSHSLLCNVKFLKIVVAELSLKTAW